MKVKLSEEVKQARGQIEKIVQSLGGQVIRYIDYRIHCGIIVADELIQAAICIGEENLEKQKEKTQTVPISQGMKLEIWLKIPGLSHFQRLRYVEKTWYQMFPIPLSVTVRQYHGNKPQIGRSRVYFILNTEKDLVKIGLSNNAKRRLHELKSHNADRLKLLKTFTSEDADKLEYTLHKKFQHLHIYGEWFSYAPELKSFIEEN